MSGLFGSRSITRGKYRGYSCCLGGLTADVLALEGVSWVTFVSSSEVECSPSSEVAASCLSGELFGGVLSPCSVGELFCGGSSPSSSNSEFDAGSSPDASGVLSTV